MLLQITSCSLVLLAVIGQCTASKFSFTLTTEELGGDSTDSMATKPLIIHVDKQNMTPEMLEKLYHTSNIVFADFPEVPEFINLNEYENMKYATEELLDQLMNERNQALDAVKQSQKFSQIETILQEIINEGSNQLDTNGSLSFGTTERPKNFLASQVDTKLATQLSTKFPESTESVKREHRETRGSHTETSSVKHHESKSVPTSQHPLSSHKTTKYSKTTKSSSYSHKLSTHYLPTSSMSSPRQHTSTGLNSTSTYLKPSEKTQYSAVYSIKPLNFAGNHVNITAHNGYDNGASFALPKTFVMAVLLTALVFVHAY